MYQPRNSINSDCENGRKSETKLDLLLSEEAGYLEAKGPRESCKFKQSRIVREIDVANRAKSFSLQLSHGPYRLEYDRNGRFLLLGGRKGHQAILDWYTKNIVTEFHTQEETRDIKWLHNETMFAVAQKKYVHIYDNNGLEIHRLKSLLYIHKLEFLPYHFLLVSISRNGTLSYQDTSTGKLVASHRTKLGSCSCMCQNPHSGIINLGHQNGTVTLWKPSISDPVAKLLCHKSPICAVAVNSNGRYMATSGLDGQIKIWDLRVYKALHVFYNPKPISALAISDRDLLATGFGSNIQIRKDAFIGQQESLFMSESIPSTEIECLKFCPYEDILGIGHNQGINSFIIPGSGEPNFDALAANPFQTRKQRQETEVKLLLEKIQPELITLNPKSILRPKKEISVDKPAREKFDVKFKLRKHRSKTKRPLKKGAAAMK
ncbi:putative U3 small nucleolar RNA-associated protein 7 [Trichoplax sp. H2]|nr:putative U3 small nucleolar RNA-associated protein 7 [Trichoplax sp. H2]|eukprot:RDD43890.1 putative U3 small nucleolar RNA-associated protein 7 [Trichoplax sp. H2]